MKIYKQVKSDFTDTTFDVIHGNIFVLKSILECRNQPLQKPDFIDIVDYILRNKDSKNDKVQKAAIEATSVLFCHDKMFFTSRYSKDFISFLLKSTQKSSMKTLCYNKIAKILDAYIELFKSPPDDLIKCITLELEKREGGPHINEIMKCLEVLMLCYKSKVVHLLDIHNVIDLLLISEGLTRSCLRLLKAACSLEIENITQIIQAKLLLLISFVLKESQTKINIDIQIQTIVQRFTMGFTSYCANRENYMKMYSEEYTYQCLSSLANYPWTLYTPTVSILVRETALKFLDDSRPNIRKVAARVGGLIYKYTEDTGSLSKVGYMNSINKFLNVASTDENHEVREIVLGTLKTESDDYLRSTANIDKLFTCLHDTNLNVKIKTLEILSRLIPYNPSAIIPQLQKLFYQSLKLIISEEISLAEKINTIPFLRTFISSCSWLVKGHCDLMAEIILKNFSEHLNETGFISILDYLGILCRIGSPPNMLKYVDAIVDICLLAIKDLHTSKKREAGLKCLYDVVYGCEIPILCYYRYPKMVQEVQNLLKQEQNADVVREALRLCGCIGAIDRNFQQRIFARRDGEGIQESGNVLIRMVKEDFRSNFEFFSNIEYFPSKSSWLRKEKRTRMLQFFENLIIYDERLVEKQYSYLLNNWSRIQKKSLINEDQQKEIDENFITQKEKKLKKHSEFCERVLMPPLSIDLSKREYFHTIAIQLCLSKLLDNSYFTQHRLLLDALKGMVSVLKREGIHHYLQYILPVLSYYIETAASDTIIVIFKSILLEIVRARPKFSQDDIDTLLLIIETHINIDSSGKENIQAKDTPAIKKHSFEILSELLKSNKQELRDRLDTLILKIHAVFQMNLDNKDIIRLCTGIYLSLDSYLDPFLDILIPFFSSLLNDQEKDALKIENDLLIEIINLFSVIIQHCPSAFNFISLIIQALLYNFDKNSYIHYYAMRCLVFIIITYTNKILVFLPSIDKVLKQRNVNYPAYDTCIQYFLETGSIEDVGLLLNQKGFQDFQDASTSSISTLTTSFSPLNAPIYLQNSTQAANAAQRTGRLTTGPSQGPQGSHQVPGNQAFFNSSMSSTTQIEIKPDEIKKLFDVSTKVLPQDWNEWLRKTTSELIQVSPNRVVYYFHPLKDIRLISKELFNISFVSAWNVLSDTQQTSVVKNLEAAIKSPNIPVPVLQTILNLVEFMSHSREPLELNVSDVADIAEKCNTYAKAIFYREQEFDSSPETSIESLLSLYTNIGQPDASMGLIQYARRVLSIDIKMEWYEKLQKWNEALDMYNKAEASTGLIYFVPKMRCLSARCDWQFVLAQCDSQEEKLQKEDNQLNGLPIIAANAALALSQWDRLEKYSNYIEEDEGNFYKAVVAIQKNQLEKAQDFLERYRKTENQVLEAYGMLTEKHVRFQQLVEMEEIIEFKRLEKNKSMLEQHKFLHGSLKDTPEASVDHAKMEKNRLIRVWNDRLLGCKRNVHYWQEILSIRSLVLSKIENLNIFLKYAKILIDHQHFSLANDLVTSIEEEYTQAGTNCPKILSLVRLEIAYVQKSMDSDPNEIINNIEEILKMKDLDKEIKGKYFSKLGEWAFQKYEDEVESSGGSMNESDLERCFSFYERATQSSKHSHKIWHKFALTNYNALREYQEGDKRVDTKNFNFVENITRNALVGFMKALGLGGATYSETFEDMLRLLRLLTNYGHMEHLQPIFDNNLANIELDSWIEVIPQLFGRVFMDKDQIKPVVQKKLCSILKTLGRKKPQAVLYHLTNAIESKNPRKRGMALKMKDKLVKGNERIQSLFEESTLISNELIRVAILYTEEWNEGIDRAYQHYLEKNYKEMVSQLENLHLLMKKTPETLDENHFFMSFEIELKEAEKYLQLFSRTGEMIAVYLAWDIYHQTFMKLNEKIKHLKVIHLDYVSPRLLSCQNTKVTIPGSYDPRKPEVYIAGFAPALKVLHSKQHPRKMEIYGNDEREHHFLLKGHEDLRQDERVMQMFRLCNRLLAKNSSTEKKELSITTFSVVPLSTNSGIIGWVSDCDTIHALIQEYRDTYKIPVNIEKMLCDSFTDNFPVLSLPRKVEVFRHVLENTKGEDFKRVLWMKSPCSEKWLSRRTNYTRSLATMSMVGYILGLGDRHPSNLMQQKYTGKIVHIDFGDCFEVAMRREKFPEKFPFRLTRMLIKPMPASGIDGIYSETCKSVMRVLRDSRDSVMAVLESFLHDPLLNWRLITQNIDVRGAQVVGSLKGKTFEPPKIERGESGTGLIAEHAKNRDTEESDDHLNTDKKREREIVMAFAEDDRMRPAQLINSKAVEVFNRIKKKLVGREFNEKEQLLVDDQVEKLIKQASSPENICQAYPGWCPFW